MKHYIFRPKTKAEEGCVHYVTAECKALLKPYWDII